MKRTMWGPLLSINNQYISNIKHVIGETMLFSVNFHLRLIQNRNKTKNLDVGSSYNNLATHFDASQNQATSPGTNPSIARNHAHITPTQNQAIRTQAQTQGQINWHCS